MSSLVIIIVAINVITNYFSIHKNNMRVILMEAWHKFDEIIVYKIIDPLI